MAKHSGASLVRVSLAAEEGRVELRVRDNGRGFDVACIPADHLGVGIMRERAQSMGAELSISSQPGRGTEVIVVWRPPPV